jgi:large subunit ribosomal protein L24
MRIKVDDTVVVLSGKDSGKKGRVTSVDLEENKVVVDGVNVVNRHVRRSQRNMQGGRLSKTMPVPAGKVMLVCPVCGKPTRVGYRFVEVTVKKDETESVVTKKERFCKKCSAALPDAPYKKTR